LIIVAPFSGTSRCLPLFSIIMLLFSLLLSDTAFASSFHIRNYGVPYNGSAPLSQLNPDTAYGAFADYQYQAYKPENLRDVKLEVGCKNALTASIQCHPYVDTFRELRYHGRLPNVNITTEVCGSQCGAALGPWFNTIITQCQKDTLWGLSPSIVAGRVHSTKHQQ
jgi:hypothetical protein